MPLFILAIIIFILADITIRYFIKQVQDKKLKEERAAVLQESLNVDFSVEAKTLKRAEVNNPKAKILCVDDEAVILDSFRKILVLDGYSVDTVEQGAEALSLIKNHHYDFVFTDLKMPQMDGVEVTKSVKSLRPDIDVVIITGYATVETAVDCMKFGAMDYVQKPFTEDEILDFTKKILIKRQEKIHTQLKPRVHIAHISEEERMVKDEFAIPGGVFISDGHGWVSINQDGTVRIGLDDFAKKVIGKIDSIDFPNLGMSIKKGQPLFHIKQGRRKFAVNSPLSGRVEKINIELNDDIETLDFTTYQKNWICTLDADDLDTELQQLKIGKGAVNFYLEEIDKYKENLNKALDDQKELQSGKGDELLLGIVEKMDDKNWFRITSDLFSK